MDKTKRGFNKKEINERFLALACLFKQFGYQNPKQEASEYMLMHEVGNVSYFKNKMTREYIQINRFLILDMIRALR